MDLDIDEFILTPEPEDLGACSLTELRSHRDELQEVENGVSYIRRLLQGRLDTVTVELDRRRAGNGEDLIEMLPEALARNTRSSGLPRPIPRMEPPDWAVQWMADLDATIPIAVGEDTPESELVGAFERLSDAEMKLSSGRRVLHSRIDRLQSELVRRYRDGAPVDDLLQS